MANKYNLKVANKPDSQDICFVPEGRYSDLVRKLRPNAIDPGLIIHVDGTILGKHKGIIDFTIGQRKGLEIGGRKDVPDEESILYVVKIDEQKNEVVVGPKKYLACDEIELKDCNWITKNKDETLDVLVKLRNTFNPVPAKVKIDHKKKTSKIFLNSPQYGISPGQAAVFYSKKDNNQIYGGGWIDKTSKYLISDAKNYKIDHLVVGSNCLEEGTYYIENLLDLKLSSIGYHKKMGTHNRVIKLGDLYLEVIAIDPDSKVEIKNTFFGLDKSFVKKKILLKPRLISFVISSTMNISSKFYPNKTYIERNKYKWNFMNPNQNILENDLFPYSDSFPSIIHWLTPSPLEEMKKNFF